MGNVKDIQDKCKRTSDFDTRERIAGTKLYNISTPYLRRIQENFLKNSVED